MARRRAQAGFTLVELMIVVVILGILAAIVTLSLIGLTGTAKSNACSSESKAVQSAMDSMMAKNELTTVTAQVGATNNFSASPAEGPLYPSFIRTSPTHGTYTWTANGSVSQSACT